MEIFINRTIPPHFTHIKESLSKRWGWYFSLGLLLIILGIIEISFAVLTTIASVIFFGWLLIAAGIATSYHATRFWKKNWREFFLYIVIGILYIVGGFLIVTNPMQGAVTLTFALAIFYLFLGVSRIIFAFTQPLPGWGWMLINGIISLFLGSFIWFYWPITSLWVIGILVGIDIISIGWWLTMLGWSARARQKTIV